MLSTNENTIENTLDLSALFYETGFFEAAEPEFLGSIGFNDEIFSSATTTGINLDLCAGYTEPTQQEQWNLFNNSLHPLADINVCGAWQINKGEGSGILIADTGIYAGLNDLPVDGNNVVPSSGPFDGDFYYNYLSSVPFHGTNVAGIIGARHNSSYSGGVSPNSAFYYIANRLYITGSQVAIANAMYDFIANNTQGPSIGVINMSFGYNAAPSSGPMESFIEYARDDAYYNGFGAVLVAGSGNESILPVLFPANHPDVIAVGGSLQDGDLNTALTIGLELDVAAPSAAVPTLGPNDIVGNFGGTSAAAPHVTGIVALMQSAHGPITDNNPIRGVAIRNIINRTAQRSAGEILFGDEPIGTVGDRQNYYGDWSSRLGPKSYSKGYGIPNATECVLTSQAFQTEIDLTTNEDILDLHMRNSNNDYGKEPAFVSEDANNYVLWNSPDIWVRNNGDYSFDHENPNPGQPATVFVRVINKSNKTVSSGDARVMLNWSKMGGLAESWPDLWFGNEQINCGSGYKPVGGIIPGDLGGIEGESVPNLAPGEEAILKFIWAVPILEWYDCLYPNNSNEYGLIARIISDDDPMKMGTLSGNVWNNAYHNNNVVWKNVQVIDPGLWEPATLTIVNNSNESILS